MHPILAESAWRELRACVHSDAALQERLAPAGDAAVLARCLADEARARGIGFAAKEAMLRPDPLGLARFDSHPPDGTGWPPPAWLPVHAGGLTGEAHVDWIYAGGKRLTEPFFQDSMHALQRLPFNRAFRYRITLADFLRHAQDAPAPDGFIMHMSRCGSTLAAQMIAALPDTHVVSEPPPLDEVLQISMAHGEAAAVEALRAMTSALARGRARRTIFKLDAWHALALPLFRRAFPDVPWVFLYRDPVEVLVSQARQRGAQMVPSMVPPSVFGLEAEVPDEHYCARVLAAICRAAAHHFALGGGLLVNYSQLPEAVEQTILPHFKIAVADGERALMEDAARLDAKAPYQAFIEDGDNKRREASDLLRALAERHLAPVYARLEAMRLGPSQQT